VSFGNYSESWWMTFNHEELIYNSRNEFRFKYELLRKKYNSNNQLDLPKTGIPTGTEKNAKNSLKVWFFLNYFGSLGLNEG